MQIKVISMQLLCISLTSEYVCKRSACVCVPGDQVSSLHSATGVSSEVVVGDWNGDKHQHWRSLTVVSRVLE